MKDRLIELLEKTFAEQYEKRGLLTAPHTADYLLTNGVIVPPCNVGDTVYIIFQEKVIQGTVRLIRPFISKEETVFKGNIICEIDSFFIEGKKEQQEFYVVFVKPYGIERIAYLTREKAEQALKEGENK